MLGPAKNGPCGRDHPPMPDMAAASAPVVHGYAIIGCEQFWPSGAAIPPERPLDWLHGSLCKKPAGEARGQARRAGPKRARLASMFLICSLCSMSRRVASRLEDIAGEGGHIGLRCPRCDRRGAVTVADMQLHCRQRRIRTDWRVVSQLFRCSGCGLRPARAYFDQDPPPPNGCVRPPSIGVPIGISPRAWHRADDYERKRLIRQARG